MVEVERHCAELILLKYITPIMKHKILLKLKKIGYISFLLALMKREENMSELFEEDDEIQPIDPDEVIVDTYQPSPSDARRRLEALLAEKKLKDELEDYFHEE